MEKTLLDEFAMSMPFESIPQVEDREAAVLVSEELGIEMYKEGDTIDLIRWGLEYQISFRYKYAKEMMDMRKKYIN